MLWSPIFHEKQVFESIDRKKYFHSKFGLSKKRNTNQMIFDLIFWIKILIN
jgi:hypothetical protein